MRTSLSIMALTAVLLSASQVAFARSLDVEAFGAPLHVFELDDVAAERATLAEHAGAGRAADDDDAPPPLGAPPDDLEDGFERYFDHHSRVQAAWGASERAPRALD